MFGILQFAKAHVEVCFAFSSSSLFLACVLALEDKVHCSCTIEHYLPTVEHYSHTSGSHALFLGPTNLTFQQFFH